MRAPSISMSPRPNWQNAAPNGRRPSAVSNAATAGCSPNISSRPMKAAISISSRRVWRAGGRAVDLLVQSSFRGARNANPESRIPGSMLRIAPERQTTWDVNDDKTKRHHPRQTENRLHRHRRYRVVQARLPHPDDPGRAPARSRSAGAGRRGLYAALHAGARGSQQDRGVSRSRPSAAQGDRGLP